MIKAQPAAKAERGHNSKVKVGGPVIADRLQSFVARIERLMEEREALQGDIKDIYSEVKGVGYDVKTLRKVIQLRGMDAADRAEQEALLDTYLHALGMLDRVEARVASGESIRKAAKAEGMPKSTAIRKLTQNAMPTENIENGSGEETPGAVPAGDGTGTADVTSSPAPAVAITNGEAAGTSERCPAGPAVGGEDSTPPAPPANSTTSAEFIANAFAKAAGLPARKTTFAEPDIAIPDFLRRLP